MRPLLFDKYEGLGNDFVVVEGTPSMLDDDDVRAICDRHRGIGADGVLFTGINAGRPFMYVVNADGSDAEMCGNGLRCIALHLVRRGLVEDRDLIIDTDSGPHACRVIEIAPPGRVEVAMRAASLVPDDVPVTAAHPLIDAELAFREGGSVKFTAVSMGNPHAVIFDVDKTDRGTLGLRIQDEPIFPEKVNVGFARMSGRTAMELHVYERGAGWTQACGTGACAAAVAAVETGRADRFVAIEVALPGGVLEIVVGEPGAPIKMTGPARHAFSGKIEI